MKKKQSLLLIGSNSFIAKYIIGSLETDYSITIASRHEPNTAHSCKWVQFDFPDSTIRNRDLLEYDVIIICASAGVQANKNVGNDLIYGLNAFYHIEVLNFLIKSHFGGKIITFGSYFEIGNVIQDVSFNESDVVHSTYTCINDYTLSKRLVSKFVHDAKTFSKINHYHFILPTIFGVGEKEHRLIPYVVKCIMKNEEIKLSGGTQVRQYLYAENLALQIKGCLDDNMEYGLYNLHNDFTGSILDLVDKIRTHFKSNATMEIGATATRDESMKYLKLNTSKLEKTIALQNKFSFEDGLNLYKDNGKYI